MDFVVAAQTHQTNCWCLYEDVSWPTTMATFILISQLTTKIRLYEPNLGKSFICYLFAAV